MKQALGASLLTQTEAQVGQGWGSKNLAAHINMQLHVRREVANTTAISQLTRASDPVNFQNG